MTKEIFMSMTKKEIAEAVTAWFITNGMSLNGFTDEADVLTEVTKTCRRMEKLHLWWFYGERLA